MRAQVLFETPPFYPLDATAELVRIDGAVVRLDLGRDDVHFERSPEPLPRWLASAVSVPEELVADVDRVVLTTTASASGTTGYRREFEMVETPNGVMSRSVGHTDHDLALVMASRYDAVEVTVNGVVADGDKSFEAVQLDEHHTGVIVNLVEVTLDRGDRIEVRGFVSDTVESHLFGIERNDFGTLSAPEITDVAMFGVSEPVVEREIGLMWRDELQTFGAIATNVATPPTGQQNPQILGTRFAEFPTVRALGDGLARAGFVLDRELAVNLEQLQQETYDTVGETHFVGVRPNNEPMLVMVTPDNRLAALDGRDVLSVDGPNWGYGGNGPAEAAEQMLRMSVGETAAMDLSRTRAFMGEVVAGLPREFSMSASGVSEWFTTGQHPAVDVTSPQIDAARSQIHSPTLDVSGITHDLAAPSIDGPELAL